MRSYARNGVVFAVIAVAVAGCRSRPPVPVPGGNAKRGAQSIAAMGCGACHRISGIAGASGLVGPPLEDIALRGIIAGELANTPENMVRWIRDPQSVTPGNAMPNLGIDDQTARDITAYLYSQH
ncbi:MAG: c-type cytochrome [Gemmatimonadaceae bacterium]